MITLVTTRFTNCTWNKNVEYRSKNSIKGCLYGSPQEMSPKIEYESIVFVYYRRIVFDELGSLSVAHSRVPQIYLKLPAR